MSETPTYQTVLGALVERDPRILVMTAENRAAIRELPAKIGPRFIDVGICEQTMVGMAAGLALRGRVPVVHALATFLTLRAYEFIRTDVGIAGLAVKFVGAVPGFLSDGNGPTHQAIDDISVMRTIPGMQIVCPADDRELVACLPEVIASPAPTYIRYNALPSKLEHKPYQLGRAELLSDGTDIGIITAGFMTAKVADACDILRGQEIDATVLNLRTLAPVDEDAICAAAVSCPVLVTVEDHLLVGGIYQIVTEILVRHRIAVPVVPVGLPGRWFRPGRLGEVLEHEGFTPARLADRFRRAFETKGAMDAQ